MAQHLMRSGVGVIGTFHQSAAEAEQMLTEADNLGHRLAFVQFDELVAVNLRAPYFLTQALLPLIKDGGRILNLSTALTHGVVTGMSAYAAVKGAVEVLTRYQAVELADRGIRVNTLTGGAAETDFGSGIMHLDEVKTLSAATITLGRIATADDIGAAVPAILSDALGWATGGNIEVSGGQSL